MSKISITLLWLLSCLQLVSFAQSYPVHLTTQLVAPFSGYLPDYANVGEEKLKILVLFTDFTKPNYNIKFKISITGQGVSIQSKSFYFDGPFMVQPGVPLEISGSDLFGLLNSQNLDFNGINKTQYEQRKVLPEGFYTFCITAYDFNNPIPIQVSNTSCTQAWLILSDPPFLNLPICSSTVTTTNPQQQTFSFTQMNMGSPNSAANTEYVFELWEVRPQGAVPNNIVSTVPPIYSYTTNLTVINYGITEPTLLKGMQYVWRVKAFDITGRDLFKNQGYSQICTFTYGSAFDGANINLNLHGQGVSQRQIKVWWDSLAMFTSYNLEFRKAGSGGTWYPATTLQSHLRILDLEPQTTYEIHVQGVSTEYTTPFSPSIQVTTLPLPNYQCGEIPFVPNSTQFKPLLLANTNMFWQVGQFEMNVTHLQNVQSSQGLYSGLGKIKMPYGVNVNCRFNNISVNNDQIVVQGKVIALTEGVDAWIQSNGTGTIQDGTVDPEIHTTTNITTGSFNVNTSNGTFTVGGNTYTYTPSGTTVQGADGEIYIVTADGTVINAGTAGTGHGPVPESKNIINTSKGTVAFKANVTQLYGLDEYTHAELVNYYLTVKNVTDNTHVPVNWKSVMAQKYDVIDLNYQLQGNLKTDSILFRTGTGTIFKPQGSGTNRKLYIVGGKHGDVQELFACYKVKADSFVNVAKINIVSYRNEQNKVTLVPLGNGISIDKTTLQKQLNEIYKGSVATWVVDVAPAITVSDTLWDKDANGHINVGSNMFSRYSSELKKINKYIRTQTYYNASEYFLVVTNKPTDSLSSDLLGEMPRARNIGYIFAGGSPLLGGVGGGFAQLIAHELGHGAFALEHSFEGNATLPKGTSTCLMDYNSGTDLYKGKYWDYVHQPVTVIGVLESDADAASAVTNTALFSWLEKIKIAAKNGTTITVAKGNSSNASIDISTPTKVYLAGIQYEFIHVAIYPSALNAIQVNCKNKITKGTITKTDYNGQPIGAPKDCIDIDGGIIKVEVPANRITEMKSYLEGGLNGKNLLLFVNGYRSNELVLTYGFDGVEMPKGADDITIGDIYNYWEGVDAQFINQIGTTNVVYADGHASIVTSNHCKEWSVAKSVSSFLLNYSLSNSAYSNGHCMDTSAFHLDTQANQTGYSTRKASGMKAGNAMIQKITDGEIVFNKTTDTLDIVCHSMGFAYAQGMIEVFKIAHFKLGRYYIIAPENACSGTIALSDFEQAWQYGSNLGQPNPDPFCMQDGIAPQCGVIGLPPINRIFIPNGVTKGYKESHSIGNYKWIFDRTSTQTGYVKKRH